MATGELNGRGLLAAGLSALGMVFSIGPVVFATFSLLMLPLAREFGWGRGHIAFGLTLAAGCAALADPVVGRLSDRFGVRPVLLAGLALFAAANAAVALTGGSLLLFYIVFALVGLTAAACGVVPYSKVLTGWFRMRRGLVLGTALGLGASVGAAVMARVAHDVTLAWGWREARLVLSLLILAVPIPAVFLLLREAGAAPSGARVRPSAVPGVLAAEARRDPTFWLLFAIIFLATTPLAGTAVHLVALLSDRGLPTATAVNLYGGFSLAGVAGRILIGLLQDRLSTPKLGVAVFACALAGMILLAQGVGGPWIWVAVALLGLGFGAEISLVAYWASRYWGLRAYGEIYGFLHGAGSAGAAVGPLLMGAAFDRSGGYGVVLTGFQIALGACVLMSLALKPYVFSVDPGPAEGQASSSTVNSG